MNAKQHSYSVEAAPKALMTTEEEEDDIAKALALHAARLDAAARKAAPPPRKAASPSLREHDDDSEPDPFDDFVEESDDEEDYDEDDEDEASAQPKQKFGAKHAPDAAPALKSVASVGAGGFGAKRFGMAAHAALFTSAVQQRGRSNSIDKGAPASHSFKGSSRRDSLRESPMASLGESPRGGEPGLMRGQQPLRRCCSMPPLEAGYTALMSEEERRGAEQPRVRDDTATKSTETKKTEEVLVESAVLPGLTTPRHLPPWAIGRLGPLLRTPERRPSSSWSLPWPQEPAPGRAT